jgi:anti-sigma factor RsiW
MNERTAIENWMLHAYADGELDAHERRDVEQLVASDSAAKAEVETWLAQKAALKEAFAPLFNERVPPSLAATLRRRGRHSAWLRPALMAAGLALLIVGAAGGWFVAHEFAPMQTASFVDRAIVAYQVYAPEVRHPVEVAASDRDHLVAWLSKRIGEPLKIPDLSREGYTLLGGRLLAAEDRPAAQLMYEDADKHRIAIFLAANAGGQDTAFLVTEKGSITACYWLNEQLGFVITGETSRDKLMSMANDVYRQFDG